MQEERPDPQLGERKDLTLNLADKQGNRVSVVLPVAEYEELLEDVDTLFQERLIVEVIRVGHRRVYR